MPGPVIARGDKVSLRIVTKDDLPVMWENLNDPEMIRFLRDPTGLFYFEDELEWYENLRKGKEKNRVFLIEKNDDSVAVGSVGLHDIDHVARHAELGYLVFKPYWGQGYASECVRLMLDYARETLNLRKVYALVKEPNAASMKVLENNGFMEVGRMKEQEYVPGEGFMDLVTYEMFF